MEKAPCRRCQRPIDPAAKLCPYCNWDQDLVPTPETPVAVALAEELRQEEIADSRRRAFRKAAVSIGVVLALIATFAIGGLVFQFGKRQPAKPKDLPQEESRRATDPVTDLTLVPAGDLTSTVGRSITTAPLPVPQGVPLEESERSDTTALASLRYEEMAQRARVEQAATTTEQQPTADPRAIRPEPRPAPPRPAPQEPRPSADAQPAAPATSPAAREREDDEEDVRRTPPTPISQPLPRLSTGGTARFRLRVGADGRVQEVQVLQTIPGQTAKLVASVQQWRFKPATENGRPVEGFHLVDVSFNAPDDED